VSCWWPATMRAPFPSTAGRASRRRVSGASGFGCCPTEWQKRSPCYARRPLFMLSAVGRDHLVPLLRRQWLGEPQGAGVAAVGPQSQHVGLFCIPLQGNGQAIQVVGGLSGIGGVIAGVVFGPGGFAEESPLGVTLTANLSQGITVGGIGALLHQEGQRIQVGYGESNQIREGLGGGYFLEIWDHSDWTGWGLHRLGRGDPGQDRDPCQHYGQTGGGSKRTPQKKRGAGGGGGLSG